MEIEKTKSYYVTLADNDKIDYDMNVAFEKIEGLKDNLGALFTAIESLEPQQKLFFLDKVVMDMILKSQMPVFYLNGLLTKMSEYIKSMNGNSTECLKEINNCRPSYLG